MLDTLQVSPPMWQQNEGQLQPFKDGFLAGKTLNWTSLDAAMDMLYINGLYPGFEVMGNPQPALFDSLKDPEQLAAWGSLVAALATRYIQRYGAENVRLWRFESWNEPDGCCDSKKRLNSGIDCDLPSFLNLFDVIEHALHSADRQLLFGGPASDGSHAFLFGLVDHCVSGKHYVTNATGCGEVAFFNVHIKGHSNAVGILEGELPIAMRVRNITEGTAYATVPWGNDEADPLVGWDRIMDWRGDARYPAMIAKAINQHIDAFITNQSLGLTYDLLGNDNGFLNYPDPAHYFTQRTLVTRFDMNLTHTIESIRKPSLNVMAMLALLGNTLHRDVTGLLPSAEGVLGAVFTSRAADTREGCGKEFSAVLYNSLDASIITYTTNITLTAVGLDGAILSPQARVAVFLLDDAHGNAEAQWQHLGSPTFPTAADFASLRRAQEVPMVAGFPAAPTLGVSGDGQPILTVDTSLTMPGVALVHVCAPVAAPRQISRVWVAPTPTVAPPETMVRWQETPDRCIRTFAVYYTPNATASAARVNDVDTVFASFFHAHATKIPSSGCYTVTAIDYWGREGPQSAPACITDK